ALFFSDLALRRAGAGLLPDYRVAILDEAHTLEDVAADHLGIQVSRGSVDYLLNKLHSPRGRRGLPLTFRTNESLQPPEATRFAAERFFADVLAWLARQPRSTGRVRQPNIVPNLLSEELHKLASGLERIAKRLNDEEDQIELTAAMNRCLALANSVQQWLEQ